MLEKAMAAWSVDWGTLDVLQDVVRLTQPQQCLLLKSLLLSGLSTPVQLAAGMLLLRPHCMTCYHTTQYIGQSCAELSASNTPPICWLCTQDKATRCTSGRVVGLTCRLLAGAADEQELCTFLEGALQVLQPVVFGAVSGSISGHASHLVTLILPALCKVAEKLGPRHTAEIGSKLWATCR